LPRRMKTRTRITQIRVVPEKANLEGNFGRPIAIPDKVAGESVDVVVTPECFLDGYVATDPRVSAEQLRRYVIDPSASAYGSSLSKWAGAASAWLVPEADGVREGASAHLRDRRPDVYTG